MGLAATFKTPEGVTPAIAVPAVYISLHNSLNRIYGGYVLKVGNIQSNHRNGRDL